MINMNFFGQPSNTETQSHVNRLVGIMAKSNSRELRRKWMRALLGSGLLEFVKLAAMRCTALKFEMWLMDDPEILLDEDVTEEDLRWEDAGFDWTCRGYTRESQYRTNLRSAGYLDGSKLRVSRVRKMNHRADPFELLQQRQLRLPSPRHLPSAEEPPSPVMSLLIAPVFMGPRRDPTPEFPSKLREMVQAQGNEKLTEMHGDFEKFRITGKQPERKDTEERSGTKRYRQSETSGYRPYSISPTKTRTQAGTGTALVDSAGSELPAAKRLRSTELFPDRYQAGEATSAPDAIQTKARDSVGESTNVPIRDSAVKPQGTGISTRDFAYPEDSTATALEDREQAKPPAQSGPEPSSVPSSRRSAARSDSSLSSVSSTESSRARKALALNLSEDNKRVELNKGKSTASVGMSSNSPSLFRSFVNAISPSNSKTATEDVAKKPSKSPTRRGSRAGRQSGSESSLDGASDGGGRLTRSSSKRARANTVPASSSKRQHQRRQIDGDAALVAPLPGVGILPEPSESCEDSKAPSLKEGTTDGVVEESHSNPASTSVDPAESEFCKPSV